MPQLSPSTAGSAAAPLAPAKLITFDGREDKRVGLFAWVRRVIEDTLSNS